MKKTFYITTPIYYVNDAPHVGSATTTLICDAVARYHRLRGEPVFFLTGTDEHAQKVADAAAKAHKPTQEFVDEISQRFVATWNFLDVSYDRFLRTSDERHKEVVAEVFKRLQASGDIYSGEYEGWYSVADETFYRESDVENGFARESGSPVERVAEQCYYFRLSAYSERLLAYIDANPDFLLPQTRKNEVLAFIKEGLRDVPVTRRNTGWGIAAPDDPSQVIYVWVDALINYLTATGWPHEGWEKLWPANAHLVGKEIYTRFHATLWPAMLMGLGLDLPEHVIGHGWWLVRDPKTSELVKGAKSKGNIPTPEKAVEWLQETSGASQEAAVDALRYYLLRGIAFTSDAEFGLDNLVARYNGELANSLGNLLNRSLNMVRQFENGLVPDAAEATKNSPIALLAKSTASEVEREMAICNTPGALDAIARFVSANDKAIQTAAPWKRHKQGDAAGVSEALYVCLEATRILSVLISPFMPHTGQAMRAQLGLEGEATWDEASRWGVLRAGASVNEGVPLFPRIDAKKQPAKEEKKPMTDQQLTTGETITIQDLMKVQLRIAEIKSAERVEGANKLLRLMVDIGEEAPRQLVAGIAENHAPEDLPGTKIVVVANLAPATIRGVTSNGMLLAATDALGRAILLKPEDPGIAPGSKIK